MGYQQPPQGGYTPPPGGPYGPPPPGGGYAPPPGAYAPAPGYAPPPGGFAPVAYGSPPGAGHKTPAGAIIGIILAVVLVLVAAGVGLSLAFAKPAASHSTSVAGSTDPGTSGSSTSGTSGSSGSTGSTGSTGTTPSPAPSARPSSSPSAGTGSSGSSGSSGSTGSSGSSSGAGCSGSGSGDVVTKCFTLSLPSGWKVIKTTTYGTTVATDLGSAYIVSGPEKDPAATVDSEFQGVVDELKKQYPSVTQCSKPASLSIQGVQGTIWGFNYLYTTSGGSSVKVCDEFWIAVVSGRLYEVELFMADDNFDAFVNGKAIAMLQGLHWT